MTPAEVHTLITKAKTPFTIALNDGRAFVITKKAHVWTPETYKDMFCVVLPGKAIVVLRAVAVELVREDLTGTRVR